MRSGPIRTWGGKRQVKTIADEEAVSVETVKCPYCGAKARA